MTRLMPRVRFYVGRDWLRGEGWLVYLCVLPRVDLMRQYEQGSVILAGLHAEARFVWRSTYDRLTGRFGPRFNFWWRSDAGVIASRIAHAAGQIA